MGATRLLRGAEISLRSAVLAYFGGLRRGFMLNGRADKRISVFSKSKALTVRYNPHRTNDSVLLKGDQTGDDSAFNGPSPKGKS